MRRPTILLTAGLTCVLAACGGNDDNQQMAASPDTGLGAVQQTPQQGSSDAQQMVGNAAQVLQQMKSDPDLNNLLGQAKGLFIVPKYGHGAVVVGARGGEGVLVARTTGMQTSSNGSMGRQDSTAYGGTANAMASGWSSPAFYNLGGVSVGAEIGGEGGAIAMLLMSDKAVNSFKGANTFSLNTGAGLTIADYSAKGQASAGKADVVMWSDTEGAFAGAQLSATDINFDEDQNQAYYGHQVDAQQILSGQVTAPGTSQLQQELPQ